MNQREDRASATGVSLGASLENMAEHLGYLLACQWVRKGAEPRENRGTDPGMGTDNPQADFTPASDGTRGPDA